MLNLMKKGRDLLSNSPITYLNEPDDPIYPKLYTDVCVGFKQGRQLMATIIVPPVKKISQKHFPLLFCVTTKPDELVVPFLEVVKNGYVVAILKTFGSSNDLDAKDLKSGVRFLLNHAFQYHIDPYRYAFFGLNDTAQACASAVLSGNDQNFSDEDVHFAPLHAKACLIYNLTWQEELAENLRLKNLPPFYLLQHAAKPIDQFTAWLDHQGGTYQAFLLSQPAECAKTAFTPYIMQTFVDFLDQYVKKNK